MTVIVLLERIGLILPEPHVLCWNPDLSYPFDSIGAILATIVEEEPWKACVWEQSDVPFPWNFYWTEAVMYRGGLELDDAVYGNSWTKYLGAHAWFNCDPVQPCECEAHNCLETYSTQGHEPAVEETAKPVQVALIVIKLPTPTPSNIDIYHWQW